jgi:hypothetical protein
MQEASNQTSNQASITKHKQAQPASTTSKHKQCKAKQSKAKQSKAKQSKAKKSKEKQSKSAKQISKAK